MNGIERDQETAFVLPHRYPVGTFLQLDARETAAAQAKLGQCKTVSKAAALENFDDRFDESSKLSHA
jgi:hypothetical protein